MKYPRTISESALGRHIFIKKTVVRTRWSFRLAFLALLSLLLLLTGRFWLATVAESLVHSSELRPADAIIVENLETEYLLFEQAGRIQRKYAVSRAIVPILAPASDLKHRAGSVPVGLADVMIRVAGIRNAELVPVEPQEPISLNAARQLRDYLESPSQRRGLESGDAEARNPKLGTRNSAVDSESPRRPVRSVIVVTSGFRSERAFLIYTSVLQPTGVSVQVEPVFGPHHLEDWTRSLHGIEEVGLQFGKLWFYRIFVL
ncbi:MAG: hypothetical protein P8Y94_14075 [Acidobacteriota bacterium]